MQNPRGKKKKKETEMLFEGMEYIVFLFILISPVLLFYIFCAHPPAHCFQAGIIFNFDDVHWGEGGPTEPHDPMPRRGSWLGSGYLRRQPTERGVGVT